MQAIGATILELLQNVSLLALVAAGYAALKRHGGRLPPAMMGPAIGILFGLGAVLSIAFGISVMPGVYVDGRNIMTSLVAVFGGPVATLVTLIIAVAYRTWLGGAGALSGIVALLASGLVGLGFATLKHRYRVPLRVLPLSALGVITVLVGAASFSLLHPAESPASIVALSVPLLLVSPLGTVLFGLALQAEDERRGLQVKHGEQAMLLEAILRSIGKGIIVADPQGRIVMTNPAARTLSAAAARSQNQDSSVQTAKALHIDGKTPMQPDALPMMRAIRGEASDDFQMMIAGPDGQYHPVNVTGRPLVDTGGNRRGGVIAFRDISNELALQESLRRNEQRFKEAVNAMENGFALFDAEDRLVTYNDLFMNAEQEADFGNPIGHTFEDLTRAFARGKLTAVNALADPEGWQKWRMDVHRNPPEAPVEIQWNDGRWMRVMERRTAEGGYVGVWTDITASKVAEMRLRDAIGVMESGFALFDADDRLIVCNAGFIDEGTRRTFGNPIGRTFEEIFRAFAKADLTAVDAVIDSDAWLRWRLEMHRNPPREPFEIHWTDGRWMRVTERRTAEGGYVGIWTDITAVKAAEARLREAIEAIPEGFVLLDADLKIKIFNRRMLDLYPNSAPAFKIGQSFAEVLRFGAQRGEYPGVSSNHEVANFVQQWMDRFRGNEPFFGEGAFRDGRWVLVSHRRTAIGDYVSIRTDITAQKQRERELAVLLQDLTAAKAETEKANESLERNSAVLRAITDAVPALVAYVDREERYRYCNDEYRDILGVEPENLIGRHISEVVEAEIYGVVKPQIDRALAGTEVAFVRPMLARGETRYVEQRYIPSRGAGGSIDGFYAIAWDITDSQIREQTLSREAQTDPLTGLLNRRGMTEALTEQAQRWRDGESQGAVLFLDMDRFKQINDTLGHDVGDELLKTFADRLRGVVRTSDKLARLGGDEFVIMISAPDAEEVAKRVAQNVLNRVRQPVRVGGSDVAISASIGIAVVKPSGKATHVEILKAADTALYEAKAAGRDRYALRQTA